MGERSLQPGSRAAGDREKPGKGTLRQGEGQPGNMRMPQGRPGEEGNYLGCTACIPAPCPRTLSDTHMQSPAAARHMRVHLQDGV